MADNPGSPALPALRTPRRSSPGSTGLRGNKTRLPRYRRSSAPPTVLITPRDKRILGHLYGMRFLDRQQVQQLEFSAGATASCKRRLTLLYHNSYVDRIHLPVASAQGSSRAIYCLDRRGAELLAADQGVAPSELDWRRGENARDLFFIAHLAATNDVWVAVIRSCRRHPWQLDWTDERELRRALGGETVPDPAYPGAVLKVIPDGHFRLEADGLDYTFALELDRGTVEEKRIRQKARGYGQWVVCGGYRRRYGTDGPRVLFVVASEGARARLERLKAWCEAERGGSMFWFAEHGPITRSDPLRDAIWQVAGRGGRHALIEGVSSRLQRPADAGLPRLG